MDDIIYYSNLYDYYKELLTNKQRDYFEEYYFHNLSLSEIADNYNISRNGIHKQIKDVIDKLNYYEDKLSLYNNSLKIKELIKNIDKEIKDKIEEII